MFDSMFTGITGIRANRDWLDVLGDNVANLNTVGYKKSRVTFEDFFSKGIKGAMAPNSKSGSAGFNPLQIGQGVMLSDISVVHTQGRIEETGNVTDLAIKGDGFFVLRDDAGEYLYTRAGAFDFDANGSLVNPSAGYRVQGYKAEVGETPTETTIDTGKVVDIEIDMNDCMEAHATKNIVFSGGLDSLQSLALDAIDLTVQTPVASTDDVVKRPFGYVTDPVLVYKDEDGFWRDVEGKLSQAPSELYSALNTEKSWSEAGFEKVPDGSVSINNEKFTLSDYSTVKEFLDAVSASSKAGVEMEYNKGEDRFYIRPDTPGDEIVISETPASSIGFFTAANIIPGTNKEKDIKIKFKRIFDPKNPDNLYFRFTPLDPTTYNEITPTETSKREVISGLSALDITRSFESNFGWLRAPGGKITINDYTSSDLSSYASIEEFLDEINTSSEANVKISYDETTDRFTIENKVAGKKLILKEEGYSSRGVDFNGEFVDEISGSGIISQGTFTGVMDGVMSGVTADGRTIGRIVGDVGTSTRPASISGSVIGFINGDFSGEGALSGRVTYYSGVLTSAGVSPIDGTVNGSNDAEIYGEVRGTSTGLLDGTFNGHLDTTSPPGPYVGNFRLSGTAIGEITGSGVVNVNLTGFAGSTTKHASFTGDLIGQVGQTNAADLRSVTPTTDTDTFTGEVEVGSAVGRMVAVNVVEGTFYPWTGSGYGSGQTITEGWLFNSMGILTGKFHGEIVGIIRGDIRNATINGYIRSNARTGTSASLDGKVTGVFSGDGTVNGTMSYIAAGILSESQYSSGGSIDADFVGNGWLEGSAIGKVTGYVLGSASGDVSGKVYNADMYAQFFDGAGKTTSAGLNINLTKGTVWGYADDADDNNRSDSVSNSIETLAQHGANIQGVVDGIIDTTSSNQYVQGVSSATINVATGGKIRGYKLLGEVSSTNASLSGSYKGYFDGSGTVEGEIQGTLRASANFGNQGYFEGKVEGVMAGVQISGHVKGYLDGTFIDDKLEGVVSNFSGEVSGVIHLGSGDAIQGVMKGYAYGEIDGQVEAVVARDGFFTKVNIETGTHAPTGGLLLVEGDKTSSDYGKVKNCYIDTDLNSPEPLHQANDVLDITDEVPDDIQDDWTSKTSDDKDYFSVNIGGNNFAVFIPSGQTTAGPEAIAFTPNLDTEVSDTLKFDRGMSQQAKINTDYAYTTSEPVYDSLGTAQDLPFTFERLDTNLWLWYAEDGGSGNVAGYGLLRFDADGSLNQDLSEVFQSPQDPETFDRDGGTLSGGDKGVVSIGYKGIYIDPPDTPYPYDKSGAPPAEYGASASKIVVDFSSVTQFSGTTDVHVGTQDGHKKGTLATIEITPSGIIVGKYDNGRERDLFQIALASFNNPRGLERADKTFFRETSNSGQAMIGVPQQGPRGSVMSRFLELSNVDLTEEFTKMIIAERSFQANIRTVTTADRFMMELLRIRA